MGKVRVLIADDHGLVRAGIRRLLEDTGEVEVVGEASSGMEAAALARKVRPDVVLMDLSMPGISGIEATREILDAVPEARVLILTVHDNEELFFRSLQAGAYGYVLKKAAPEELAQAVRAAARGECYLDPAVAGFLVRQTCRDRRGEEVLTVREREIVQLISEGMTTAEIAKTLSLSPQTVATHRKRILSKLGLHDRAALVRYAAEKGLIPPR